MNASTSYKVRVSIENRDDGGLRVWSEDLPEPSRPFLPWQRRRSY